MRVYVERDVAKPAGEVAAYFFDVANNPEWQSGMKSCAWTSEPPIAVGSTYEQVAEFRGKPVLTTFEVTDYEPDRLLRIESIKSTFPIQVTRLVEIIDDESCKVSADISGQPGGVMKLLRFFAERVVRKSVEADYDRLAKLLSP